MLITVLTTRMVWRQFDAFCLPVFVFHGVVWALRSRLIAGDHVDSIIVLFPCISLDIYWSVCALLLLMTIMYKK